MSLASFATAASSLSSSLASGASAASVARLLGSNPRISLAVTPSNVPSMPGGPSFAIGSKSAPGSVSNSEVLDYISYVTGNTLPTVTASSDPATDNDTELEDGKSEEPEKDVQEDMSLDSGFLNAIVIALCKVIDDSGAQDETEKHFKLKAQAICASPIELDDEIKQKFIADVGALTPSAGKAVSDQSLQAKLAEIIQQNARGAAGRSFKRDQMGDVQVSGSGLAKRSSDEDKAILAVEIGAPILFTLLALVFICNCVTSIRRERRAEAAVRARAAARARRVAGLAQDSEEEGPGANRLTISQPATEGGHEEIELDDRGAAAGRPSGSQKEGGQAEIRG